jgi:uncharacterized membrane protein YcaP (DUF421 family)
MIMIVQSGMLQALHDASTHMWLLPISVGEKILRPVIVYLVLVVLLRIFGKRELAQLNPFDLVVLLSLSNTVQNAIIGDDNSVSGGVIGAFSLLAINWVVARVLFKSPKLTRLVEGSSAVLIRNGKIDPKALEHESLTSDELVSAIHKQGFPHLHEVGLCQLEPNGNFYIEPREPALSDKQHSEVMDRLEALTKELAALRAATSGS